MKSSIAKVCELYKAGNITIAMQLAERFPADKIAAAFMERGKTRSQAADIAYFLKSKPSR